MNSLWVWDCQRRARFIQRPHLDPWWSHEMQLSLIVSAHSSTAGIGAPTQLWPHWMYIWTNVWDDCTAFIRQSLLCVVAKAGWRIPRSSSTGFHGNRPNDVIHFDYIFMGLGLEDTKYVLVIKNDVSSYTWLYSSSTADAEHTVSELTRWIGTPTLMHTWVSYQVSHFKNRVIQVLSRDFNIDHHFTVAYSPWVHGTVANVMHTFSVAAKPYSLNLSLPVKICPFVIGLVMTNLNESPLKRLGTKADKPQSSTQSR